jgi:catechol 2,3-dioxygenase-like lactoylglutathione lyase family enzyme
MSMVTVGHVALFVPNLRQAETFYQHVFNMQLLMREAELDNHLWYTLPTDKGWADAEAAGIELGMLALRRDAFILALFQCRPVPQDTVLEIGISMTAEAIAAVRNLLPNGVEIIKHEHGDVLFRDPFGYLWHLRLAGKAFQSNGESSGRWLKV